MYWCWGLFLPRSRTLQFPLLNFLRLFSLHFPSSLWVTAQPSGISATPPSFVSFGNLRFMCLETVPRISCSITFPCAEVRLTRWYFPFFHFLKIGVTFAVFQSSSTSSYHHDCLKIVESGLKRTSASSLSTHRYFLLGPTDLHMLSLLMTFTSRRQKPTKKIDHIS